MDAHLSSGSIFFLKTDVQKLDINLALQMRPFVHAKFRLYHRDCLEKWLQFLHEVHLLIRKDHHPKYDQAFLQFAEIQRINTTCMYTSEDSFKMMRTDTDLQDELTSFHLSIPIFKRPLKKAT